MELKLQGILAGYAGDDRLHRTEVELKQREAYYCLLDLASLHRTEVELKPNDVTILRKWWAGLHRTEVELKHKLLFKL